MTPTRRRRPLAALRDQRLKIAAVEAVISRIDTHLVHIPGGDGRDLGHEVDVGHNGCPETVGTQLPDDVFQIFTFAPALRRKAHDLSPARSIRSIWATLAAVSLVSVLVIDWQATGCPPPIVVRPMRTSHAVRRMNFERFIGLSIR